MLGHIPDFSLQTHSSQKASDFWHHTHTDTAHATGNPHNAPSCKAARYSYRYRIFSDPIPFAIYNRPIKDKDTKPQYHTQNLTFETNISNSKAIEFYKERGVDKIAHAYELKEVEDATLMTTLHCIRRTFGKCLKTKEGNDWKEPLYLVSGKNRLQLHFNCKECKMTIKKA